MPTRSKELSPTGIYKRRIAFKAAGYALDYLIAFCPLFEYSLSTTAAHAGTLTYSACP